MGNLTFGIVAFVVFAPIAVVISMALRAVIG